MVWYTVCKELKECDLILPRVKDRCRKFTTLAEESGAHHGWQKWHKELDDRIVAYLDEYGADMTDNDFVNYLKDAYKLRDVIGRFPKFEEDLDDWFNRIKTMYD